VIRSPDTSTLEPLLSKIATLKPEKLRKAFASSKEVDQVLKGEIEYGIKNSIVSSLSA
jgi:hypothetical protein